MSSNQNVIPHGESLNFETQAIHVGQEPEKW